MKTVFFFPICVWLYIYLSTLVVTDKNKKDEFLSILNAEAMDCCVRVLVNSVENEAGELFVRITAVTCSYKVPLNK